MQSKIHAALLALVFVSVSLVPCALAQQEKQSPGSQPAGLYRIQFVLSELRDGKQINSRHYEMLAKEGETSRLRAGARVPVSTSANTVQILEMGMNIDCRVEESDGRILLKVTADSSSFSLPPEQKPAGVSGPIIQQMRSQVDTGVLPGKPTLISSMDDPSSNSRFQLEVTATRVK